MENQTRFDLNAAIENWRQELAAQAGLTAEVRRELETHLRDAIAGFQQRGLNDEESFWLARRRVGQPEQLAEEFAKADPVQAWRERVFWMWLAVFLSSTLGRMISSGAFALMPVRGGSFLDRIMAPQIVFLLSILIPLIIVVLLGSGKMIRQFSKLTPLIENRLRLAITTFGLIALSATFQVVACAMYNARIHNPPNHNYLIPIGQILGSACYHPLIIALILVWLASPQNRKTPKRA
jgi:hypothetical protein